MVEETSYWVNTELTVLSQCHHCNTIRRYNDPLCVQTLSTLQVYTLGTQGSLAEFAETHLHPITEKTRFRRPLIQLIVRSSEGAPPIVSSLQLDLSMFGDHVDNERPSDVAHRRMSEIGRDNMANEDFSLATCI